MHNSCLLSHEHLATNFVIQPDPKKTTRGEATCVEGKSCPSSLQPWLTFPNEQEDAFNRAHSRLQPSSDPQRRFESVTFYRGLGRNLAGQFIGSEMDLRYFQANVVEARVKEIMEALDLPVFFENNSRPLDSTNEEVVARTQGPISNGALPQPANADRYCIRKKSANQEELLLLSEYKAPHKLKKEYIRAALNNSSGIDVLAVRDEPRLGDDKREQFLFKARQLVAAAATQIYHYMLQGGCKYGCIITGDVIVFLRIDDHDTTILNYHVAEPTLEVGEDSSHPTFPYALTAIAQLTSFCLMANDCPRQSKSWSNQSLDKASIWRADYSEIINSTPKALQKIAEKIDQKLFQEDTAYHGRKGKMNSRSPYPIRKRQPPAGCGKDISTFSGDRDDSDDEPGYNPDQDSPIKRAVEKKSAPHRAFKEQKPPPASGSHQQKRSYCTQACILGLVRGHQIDPICPNALSHPRSTKDCNKHALSKKRLCFLLRQQLARTLDEDCVDLNLGGARGMLFQLTLQFYQYTFVGKGTIKVFIPDVKHEGRIYGILKPLQGNTIPVCLGNIDLDVPWYDVGIEIVHMLLLSYGGTAIAEEEVHCLEDQITEFEGALAARGITHQDLESQNILWNEELGRAMFIDFERSSIQAVTKQRAPLGELSPNRNRQPKPRRASHQWKPLPAKSAVLSEASDRLQKGDAVKDVFESLAQDEGQHSLELAGFLDGLLPYSSPLKKNCGAAVEY